MKLSTVEEKLSLKKITDGTNEEFDGVYVGDLLSRCMSHVRENNLWITIMSNINTVAVASLTEASAVILAEGVELGEDVRKAAEEKEVCIYLSDKSAYELCREIALLIR